MVWPKRKSLGRHCTQILKDASGEEKVLESAIRVLVFLGEPSICELCEPLVDPKDRHRRFAALVPVLVPALCDRDRYEAKVLDPSLRLEDRSAALLVLASVGADIGRIYRLVRAQRDCDANAQGLDFFFVSACAHAPFADAVPLLEECMKSATTETVPDHRRCAHAVQRIPWARHHRDARPCVWRTEIAQIRQCAAISLSRRRSRVALTSLIAQYAKEDDEALAVSLASAIVASGPRSAADLQSARHNTLGIQLWQCILATRLRDATIAERLVEFATDCTLNWQLRRVAIFAAGRLPYERRSRKSCPS